MVLKSKKLNLVGGNKSKGFFLSFSGSSSFFSSFFGASFFGYYYCFCFFFGDWSFLSYFFCYYYAALISIYGAPQASLQKTGAPTHFLKAGI